MRPEQRLAAKQGLAHVSFGSRAKRELVSASGRIPGLGLLEVAGLGWAGEGRADLVVEAHFGGERKGAAFLAYPARAAAEARLEITTEPARTARIEHSLRPG